MSIKKRVANLERNAEPLPEQQALVLILRAKHDDSEVVGVHGLDDVPRNFGEGYSDYLDRLDLHLRATRGRALPVVAFCRYVDERDDD